MPDVRGAFPNIDRRTMTAGRYEGATAEKAVPFFRIGLSCRARFPISRAVGNLVCERIAAGETLNKIASEPGMPSRSTIDRWCTDRPEFKRQYDIAVQLRADGLLEETIEIIDDKKEIVTETTTEDEDGTKRVSKAFTKEGLAYAMARINIRYKTLSKMLPRKWGDQGHGLGLRRR